MKLDNIEVSFALYQRVATLKQFAARHTIQPGQGGDCPNCHDQNGFMYLYELKEETDHYRPGMLPLKTGGYGRFAITGWPCPICNTEKINQTQEQLAKNSGLCGLEFDWKIDHCKKMKGKENMIKMARGLLKQIPMPSGFHTLYGNYGVGKSGLAKSVVAEMVKAGGHGVYRRAADILLEAKSTFSNDSKLTEDMIISRYKSVQLLVIDEVDRTSKSDWSTSTVFQILDHRYNERHKICTIVITNEHPDKLDPSFGYLASRMKDGYRIAVGGVDLRGL